MREVYVVVDNDIAIPYIYRNCGNSRGVGILPTNGDAHV